MNKAEQESHIQALLDCKEENGGVPISIREVASMKMELQALKAKEKKSCAIKNDDVDTDEIFDEPPEDEETTLYCQDAY